MTGNDDSEETPQKIFGQLDSLFEKSLQPYVVAVGMVCYEWNRLLESLGTLFSDVTGAGQRIGMAVWYSQRSDRSQIAMLRAAIAAKGDEDWPKKLPRSRSDLEWLILEAEKLANERNLAVHAPLAAIIESGRIEIIPHFFFGNPLAEKLLGTQLLPELTWCSAWARELRTFTDAARSSILWERATWPTRPAKPQRAGPKYNDDEDNADATLLSRRTK